ncbi:MAG: hypothetical protein ABI642_18440, partial [Polaromonas sp.]
AALVEEAAAAAASLQEQAGGLSQVVSVFRLTGQPALAAHSPAVAQAAGFRPPAFRPPLAARPEIAAVRPAATRSAAALPARPPLAVATAGAGDWEEF